MEIRTRYTLRKAKDDESLSKFDAGKTQQHFGKEVNINDIMENALKVGQLPEGRTNCFYGDVSEISDFNACQQVVRIAEQNFMELDPKIREQFNNDPGELIDFLEDTDNDEEAIKMGLKVPKEVKEPLKKVGETLEQVKPMEADSTKST